MLNRVIITDCDHVRELCISYQNFYNESRPHQGIDGEIPNARAGKKLRPIFENLKVDKKLKLNGLVTKFELAAA